MQNLLITGGAGFIGSNLLKKLSENDDYNIDVVDNLSNGHLKFVPEKFINDRFFVCDFDSPHIIERIKSGYYDAVIHLAANPRVLFTVEYPFESHQVNVTSTLRLLDACRGNIKRFVFASTSAIYGNSLALPSLPDGPVDPRSPYALQKLSIENYLKLFYQLYDFDSVSLRFFNVFGPNQLGNSPYSTAVSAWINAILKGKPMRSDGDGSQSRDMCYVDNVVNAILSSLKIKESLCGQVFNVGCGVSTTNKTILNYLLKKFPDASFYEASWRPGDVMHTRADITKTKNYLGYSVDVPFKEGLDRTIQWYQDNFKLILELSTEA
jgi:nucleoside-diphosphate-sugar epimerase